MIRKGTGKGSTPPPLNLASIEKLEVLDTETLTILKGLEKPSDSVSFLNDLIDTFIKDSPLVLKTLYDALLMETLSKSAKHYAHQLKGLSINIGLRKLAALAEFVETEWETGRVKDYPQLRSLFEKYHREAVENLLRDWRR